MSPATEPRSARAIRVLGLDAITGELSLTGASDIASLFEPGDLLVVNDAATLPASFTGRTDYGAPIELRLAASLDDVTWIVAFFGDGDWRTKTEDRPPAPALVQGERLFFDHGLVATVVGQRRGSPLVIVRFGIADHPKAPIAEVWSALYRAGRPVQYSHVPEPLALWDVQNLYAGRPWAVEMPSAGRAIRAETLALLAKRGVEVASLTHAAGLSSIGTPELDAELPLPERYEIPEVTVHAIANAKRVIAIGTSVVRALEGNAAANDGRLVAGMGVTDLILGPGSSRRIVDAVLTGVHEAETSHFSLLHAFASKEKLARALEVAIEEGLLGHEFGDSCLVWGTPKAATVAHGCTREARFVSSTPRTSISIAR